MKNRDINSNRLDNILEENRKRFDYRNTSKKTGCLPIVVMIFGILIILI